MTQIPFQNSYYFHFVGIGGIGMSGIAEILHNQGYLVKGSDISENANTRRLTALGIPIHIGHDSHNIRGAQVLIVSSAIFSDNPEIIAARTQGLPVITRGEMLAEIVRFKKTVAVSGTHGKTTTTSMIAHILNCAGMDPTVINGGIINQLQTNAKLGGGDWFVVEADESDGSFLKLPSNINVVTNIEMEHMEYFRDEEKLEKDFTQFFHNVPFYGLSVGCLDNDRIRKIFHSNIDRRTVSYGFCEDAQFCSSNLQLMPTGTQFDLTISLENNGSPLKINNIFLPTLGKHNVLNALAAIAVAHELRIDWEIIKKALAQFPGVKRRFTILGVKRGITFVDDYAHHPSEIAAVLDSARQTTKGQIIVVFQAHRYTRFSRFWDRFLKVLSQADVVIALPVYSAGEKVIADISGANFIEELSSKHKAAYFAKDPQEVLQKITQIAKTDDCVIGMGAGSISDYMYQIYEAFS